MSVVGGGLFIEISNNPPPPQFSLTTPISHTRKCSIPVEYPSMATRAFYKDNKLEYVLVVLRFVQIQTAQPPPFYILTAHPT